MIGKYYNVSLNDCMTLLRRNKFNILTTLQELELIISSSNDTCTKNEPYKDQLNSNKS